ncbi:hypothetical protein M9H77_08419 [Catharanthus roseus]|uniref:Uncharacterized protein n=1 Tax=Catharanthus roseus TaxID=4058 RepID=A0ACC0BXW0_CATRO|nr:hypothetical protein M9H77_08419 [Catharanthus roseus]
MALIMRKFKRFYKKGFNNRGKKPPLKKGGQSSSLFKTRCFEYENSRLICENKAILESLEVLKKEKECSNDDFQKLVLENKNLCEKFSFLEKCLIDYDVLKKKMSDLTLCVEKFTKGKENFEKLLGSQRSPFDKNGIGYTHSNIFSKQTWFVKASSSHSHLCCTYCKKNGHKATKLLHHMISNIIIPNVGHKSSITNMHAFVMLALHEHRRMNFGYMAIEHMLATQSSSTKCLPYGCFITKILQHFVINLVGIGDHIGHGKIYTQQTFKRMGFEKDEDGTFIRGEQDDDDNDEEDDDEDQEDMDMEEEDSDEEMEVEVQRRETRQKKRQERTEEGSSLGSMSHLMDMIASLQTSMNTRFDAFDGRFEVLDGKVSNIQERLDTLDQKMTDTQERVKRLEQGGRDRDD